jgi:hypothetical protein
MPRKRSVFLAAALAAFSATSAEAGVPVGSSTIIPALDYSDTFTVGTPARADGLYNDNSTGGYAVENTYGNAATTWAPINSFSFNSGLGTTVPEYPTNDGNDGAASGLAQSGGGDFSFNYGMRNNYTIQFDAILPGDRLDVTSLPAAGGGIFAGNSLSVFFRLDSVAGTPHGSAGQVLPGIGIFSPSVGEVPVLDGGGGLVLTGASAGAWNNYAVNYDKSANRLKLYVNESLKADLDLTTFGGTDLGGNVIAPGAYQNYSNGAVGAGGSGGVFWVDNLQVGGSGPIIVPDGPHPDPGNLPGLPAGLVGFWDFDEAAGAVPGRVLNFAYDRQGANNGSFQGGADRVPGIIGKGAASFDNAGGTAVNVGSGGGVDFTVSTGIAIEAMIQPNWSGTVGDYDEIFRKEDGNNRILFSFQNDANGPIAFPPVGEGPVLSFGLNIGGIYDELDLPLNVDLQSLGGAVPGSGIIYLDDPGIALGPNDVVLKDGGVHHVVATYDVSTGEKAIFINGLKRWAYNLGPSGITSGGGADAFIGAVNGVENFDGIIDEVAFWSRGLNAEEIAEHYGNVLADKNYFGMSPPDEGLNGDTNGDGKVDLEDLNAVRNNFGNSGQAGSTPGDAYPFNGIVDLEDLNAVRNNFGAAASSSVPEPSTWALFSVAGAALAMVARRRRS